MADNMDHNLRTIDGLKTFHEMGMIGTVTPWKKSTRQVPRISHTKEDILSVGKINIKLLTSLDISGAEDPSDSSIDKLWDISQDLKVPHLSFSGMIQGIYKGSHPGKPSLNFLPMIDLDPGNLSCIFSISLFVCVHAK